MNTSWAYARTSILSIVPDYISCLKAGYECRIKRTLNSEVLFPVEDAAAKWVYVVEIISKRSKVPVSIKTLNQITKVLLFWKPRYRCKLDMGDYFYYSFSYGDFGFDIRIPKRAKERGDKNGSLSTPRM